ncbi:hypothetical protein NQ315_009396 [Exocentrus adspersus]|uniref:Uncharacterized protein n=1 Tax=Exocentrus adspersus TaxID=1586481 RepID=A0AAV8WIH2_9CUCU|nr:hypothetical protein NQ315_009396 [Exocentrus adspersus]
MRLTLLLGLMILAIIQWVSANENNATTDLVRLSSSKGRLLEVLGNRLKYLWTKFAASEDNGSFMGRCFGAARRLKFAMPLILIKLGVIITVLAFLTIFSLKTLGLLALLVLFHVSGAMSRIAVAFSGGRFTDSKTLNPPQNVHFHVHQTKDGNYDVGHTAVGVGFDDKLGKYGPSFGSSGEDFDSMESSNLYNKILLNRLLLKKYGHINANINK